MNASETPKATSKYTIFPLEDGFSIRRAGGLEVHVWYRGTFFRLRDEAGYCGHAPVYAANSLLEAVSDYFLERVMSHRATRSMWRDAKDAIRGTLSQRVYTQWQRLIAMHADDESMRLAKAFYHSVQSDASVLHNITLYTDKYRYLRADLQKYHAARMFAASMPGLSLDEMLHWRDRLTPVTPTPALHRTLDAVPTGVVWRHITRLSTIRLEKPVTDRLTLTFLLCASDHHNFGLHQHHVIRADAAQIIEAASAAGWTLKQRSKVYEIGGAASYILDYPEPFGGNLVGLARRSLAWHADERAQAQATGRLPPVTSLPLLPLDYDALAAQGITPLRTAGDVYAEAERMRHCVASYVSKAHAGLCYLFHAEYTPPGTDMPEHATIEVHPDLTVVQAVGPGNLRNRAAQYGARLLAQLKNSAPAEFREGWLPATSRRGAGQP